MSNSAGKLTAVAGEISGLTGLSSVLTVVSVSETGPDWILRGFDATSVKMRNVKTGQASGAALERATQLLGDARASLPAELAIVLNKLERADGPSDNIHWSDSQQKVLIIDME